ncbi:MAG: hypothetical protein HUJ27_09205 [Rhodobacteraceae bacterium]|nr:hypothetical protein [Paracoccaceae bacterium]
MTDITDIRTHPDGSIDYGFYMAQGRRARSQVAHDMINATTEATSRKARTLGQYFSQLFSRPRPVLG